MAFANLERSEILIEGAVYTGHILTNDAMREL
jgi:hypothetical protein